VNFDLPDEIEAKLAELDDFIEREIEPLERQNLQYFDHRREHARTDWDGGGKPRPEWEALLAEMRRRADAAGHLRYGLPRELGGSDGGSLAMAVIREHLAAKGLGLHNDLQNEASIVGNFPVVIMLQRFGTDAQKAELIEGSIVGTRRIGFGLTEPDHGSDATFLETTAVRDGNDWIINGAKRFNSGLHNATHDLVFARSSGEPGQADGITCFIVPTDTPGFSVDFMWWTFNMPSDHAEVTLDKVRVPASAMATTGSSPGRSASTPACTTPHTTWYSRARAARTARPRASRASSCRPTHPASRSTSCGGRSTCRATTPR